MGRFVNPDAQVFQSALNAEIYVDKTGLIEYTNKVLGSTDAYICNSRPRRFGKSTTANMLAAYYSKGCDSKELFDGLQISHAADYTQHLNRSVVIHLDMQWFLTAGSTPESMVGDISACVLEELRSEYHCAALAKVESLPVALSLIYQETKDRFVIIIDEWDVLIRDAATDKKAQDEYIDFLRGLFKGVEPMRYIELAYLTGILPIKKTQTQSAMNNFNEFTMLDAGILAPYVGFTDDEVKQLCHQYNRDFAETKRWYNGYLLNGLQVYNPKAVVSVMQRGKFRSYWSETASYDVVVPLINMDFDGLRTAIIEMLSGGTVSVNAATFRNDGSQLNRKDDVLTYLIHLGYLGYDQDTRMAFVPNEEIRQELALAVEDRPWSEMQKFLQQSNDLLLATLDGDTQTVAAGIESIHNNYISSLQYNNENSLSCVLAIAYLGAMQYYFKPVRELPAGRGFADFVYIPKPEYRDSYPALVVELKWNKNAETAINQIKQKKYPDALQGYAKRILLVGISYEAKTKQHYCAIEEG